MGLLKDPVLFLEGVLRPTPVFVRGWKDQGPILFGVNALNFIPLDGVVVRSKVDSTPPVLIERFGVS
jgi:hypothetical protein